MVIKKADFIEKYIEYIRKQLYRHLEPEEDFEMVYLERAGKIINIHEHLNRRD